MAGKKNAPDFDPSQLDQLLDLDTVVDETVKEPEVKTEEKGIDVENTTNPDAPTESEAERALKARIAELEAKLAAAPAPAPSRPKPAELLTPEERRIRELEDQLARRNADALDKAPEQYETPTSGDTILIHFVEDGFTALGRTWYRGQEIEFDVHGEAYESTKDRNGRSWLEDSEADQGRRYKKLYWRRGPWPGDGYAEDAAAQAERQRARKAPIPASV